MINDDEQAVFVGNGPEPRHEPLDRVRVMPNGRYYRIPEKGKKVVYLEEDCGLILEDVEFLRHMPGLARYYMDGDPFLNAEWKKRNLIPFRRPWRPSYRLPK